MFVYNCQASGNPFGFADKRTSSVGIQSNRQRAAVRSTSKRKSVKKRSKKKNLTVKNVKFLKALGFKVKNK